MSHPDLITLDQLQGIVDVEFPAGIEDPEDLVVFLENTFTPADVEHLVEGAVRKLRPLVSIQNEMRDSLQNEVF